MAEAAPMDEEDQDHITKVHVPDPNMVGYVIGRSGRTINRLMGETKTYVQYDKDNNEFTIEGEAGDRYAAKLKIKEIISNGLKTQTENFKKCWRFPFVDSNGSPFMLEAVYMNYPNSSAFKVVTKDPLNSVNDPSQSTDYSRFSNQIMKVLQSIDQERRDDVITNIWSHFGHLYVSNVHYDETTIEFNAQELMSHVNWDNTTNTTKWRTKFVGGIVDGLEPHSLNAWMTSRTEKGIPFIRYECVYYTPSCRVIRVKIFLEINVIDNVVTYKNIPKSGPVANIIKASDTEPYFYLCGSTVKRAMVDVFQPADELDFRFIIDSGSKFQKHDQEEVDVLFTFIRDNMTVKQNSGLELLQENLPRDFDLCYARVSERRTYPFTSEDDEQFTVKLSYEHIVNGPTSTSETTVDIHLQHDEWNRMLEDGTWTPQKILDKVPQFMKCARILARILKASETTPKEILDRGPKAQEAFNEALKSGKAKYCRVPVVLVGQSGAGKTSLLRSLRREKFNPNEDSTDGVRLHRSLSKAEADTWHEDDTFESSFVECTAQVLAENLSSSFNGVRELTSGHEDDNDDEEEQEAHNLDKVDEVAGPQNVGSSVEENDQSLEVKERMFKNETEVAVIAENPNEFQTSTPSDLALSQGTIKENPIPNDIFDRTTDILQDVLDSGKQEIRECVHLVTLDFAGQPVYNATHPVFLPKRGIYVLVNSLEKDIHAKATPTVKSGSSTRQVDDHCPMTNMNHLEFWLSFVASLGTTDGNPITDDNTLQLSRKGENKEQKAPTKEAKLPKRLPPVFFVCTHADIPFQRKDATKMSRDIFSYLKKDNAPGGNHIVRGIYTVNNTVSGERESEEEAVENLRAHIYQIATKLPHVNDVVPLRWLRFEKQLSDLSNTENKKYLTLEDTKAIAVQCQIAVDTEEFNTVLNYLHDLNVIIHFEDTTIVIIDIQWLLDMIVKIITVQPIEEWDDEYEEQWNRLENEGILEGSLIDHVWENETTANSLLMIMEKFSLLCRWKRSDAPDIFLVPTMLMNSDAKLADELLGDQKTSKTLVVRFKSTHLPLGIFPRLLVIIAKTCNEKWPDSPQPTFYHNFCRFYDVGDHVRGSEMSFDLLVTSDIKTISFSVINEQGIIGLPLKTLCRFTVDFLSKTLKDMRSRFPWLTNAEYEFCIQCPVCYSPSSSCKYHKVTGCTRDACLHFITEDELRNKPARCYRNHSSKSTSFQKEKFSDWFDVSRNDDQETRSNTAEVVTKTIQLLALEDTPAPLEVSQSHEIVPYDVQGSELSVPECSAEAIARFEKLFEELKSYKTSMKDPPADAVKQCRNICQQLKGSRRKRLIEELRKYVPSGTTGPLEEEHTLYEQLDAKKKQDLTRALCGQEIPRKIVCKFGKSKTWEYYERQPNPVDTLLEEEIKNRRLTLGELYDVLVKCDANAVADEHL